MVTIRPAAATDCAAIADIYRHYVERTVATFDLEAPTAEQWCDKLASVTGADRPFLVAADDDGDDGDGAVVGFAYLGPFRPKRAYAQTAEDTIYLRPDAGGRGIGSALLSALLTAAEQTDLRQIIAVIAATGGEASIALHAKHGFAEVGRTAEVGFKHGQWVDTVYMQRRVTGA